MSLEIGKVVLVKHKGQNRSAIVRELKKDKVKLEVYRSLDTKHQQDVMYFNWFEQSEVI